MRWSKYADKLTEAYNLGFDKGWDERTWEISLNLDALDRALGLSASHPDWEAGDVFEAAEIFESFLEN